MNQLVNMVRSNDAMKMLEATGRIRRLLSIGTPACAWPPFDPTHHSALSAPRAFVHPH